MPNTGLHIRLADENDIRALSSLMNELGYATTEDEMGVRYDHIQSHPDYKTFVAVCDHEVVGMIGLTRQFAYEYNEMYLRIVALVVSASYRNKGVGKLLLQQAEEWAKEIKTTRLVLTSGNREERKEAHLFYLSQGFEHKASGFVKKLA